MPQLEIRKKGRNKLRRRDWPSTAAEFSIGRSSAADVVLHHSSISRMHCTIERTGGEGTWRVRDHHSRHGMKVNGVRRSEAVLSEGDRIHLGPYELVFHAADVEPADSSIPLETAADRVPLEDDSSDASSIAIGEDDSGEDLTANRAEIERLEEALQKAREELRAAGERAASDAERSTKAEERTADLQSELRRAQDDLKELRDARRPPAPPSHDDEESHELREEIDSLRIDLARVKSERDDLRSEVEPDRAEFARAKADRVELQRSVESLREQIAQAQGECESLRAEIEPLRAEVTRLQAERDDALARFAQSARALAELEAELESVAAAGNRAADLERSAREKGELAEAFRAQVAAALESAEESTSRLRAAEESLSTLRAERSRTEELLQEAQKAFAQAEEDSLRSRVEMQAMSTRVEEVEAALQSADAARNEAVAAAAQELQNNLADRQRELDLLRADYELLRVDREKVRAQLERVEEEVKQRQIAPAPDPAEIESLRRAIVALQERLAETERTSSDRQQRLGVAQQNIEQFRRAIADTQKDRDTWSTRARLAQAQVENFKKELAENRNRIHAYESLLVDYVTQLQATGQLDAAVVEMSAEEIRRAQRSGATIVELDPQRR